MFDLSDARRRLVCRVLFVLACCLPTGAVTYRLFHPFSKSDWERLIKSEIGLPLHCDTVETPSPSRVVLRNVTLDGAAYAGVAVIPEIQISFQDIVRIKIPYNVTLDTLALAELRNCIQSGTLAHANPDRNWVVTIDKAVINNRQNLAQSLILSAIDFNVSPKNNGHSIARTKFRTHSDESIPPIDIVLERQHANNETSLQRIYINMGDWLPSWLVAACIPELNDCGPNSKIALRLELERSGNSWVGNATGQATGVELESWAQNLTAQIAGTATLSFECNIANNKIKP